MHNYYTVIAQLVGCVSTRSRSEGDFRYCDKAFVRLPPKTQDGGLQTRTDIVHDDGVTLLRVVHGIACDRQARGENS